MPKIEMKHLVNKVNDGKRCIAFNYILNPEGIEKIICKYNFIIDRYWRMQVIMFSDDENFYDNSVYNNIYNVPTYNLPLTTIANMGLMYFQKALKDEIQAKMNIDFAIGAVLGDL